MWDHKLNKLDLNKLSSAPPTLSLTDEAVVYFMANLVSDEALLLLVNLSDEKLEAAEETTFELPYLPCSFSRFLGASTEDKDGTRKSRGNFETLVDAFIFLDKNKDGYVSKDELIKSKEQSCPWVAAPPPTASRRRPKGPGPRPTTSHEYNLRVLPPSNVPVHNNLVSDTLGNESAAMEALTTSIQTLSDQMAGFAKDFNALKPLVPAVNELVKLPSAKKTLAGSVKDAEQQTAALNLALARLESASSSKTSKQGGHQKKPTAAAGGVDANLKHKAANTGDMDQASGAAKEDGDPSDPSSSSDESRSPSPRRGRKSSRPASSSIPALGSPLPSRGPLRRRLTPAEMDQRKKDGLCYFCDDKYVPGHKCKKLYRMELVADHDDDGDAASGADEEESSLHALLDLQTPLATDGPVVSVRAYTGVRSPKYCTMKLPIYLGGLKLAALIDTGSTNNFIDERVAAHLGFSTLPGTEHTIRVGNGDLIRSPGVIPGVPVVVGSLAAGEPVLPLGCRAAADGVEAVAEGSRATPHHLSRVLIQDKGQISPH
nr:unnamed protein product [Digitaria exilis]